MADFHGVLAPLWHAQPGPSRVDNTCAAVGDLRSKAAVITQGEVPPPARANEAAWREAATALVGAVNELDGACQAEGRPAFDQKFTATHEAFHRLMELAE